ncbi:hypothetical protein BsWGS_20613 [Bradybaena similaris]
MSMFDSVRGDDQRPAGGDRFMSETSHNLTLQAGNPWEQDSRSVAGVRNCLVLADKLAVTGRAPESSCLVGDRLSQLPSMKLMAVQREITKRNNALHQVKQTLSAVSLEAEISEFLHCHVIEKRMNMVNRLCSDLDLVLKNMDVLLHRFLKPFVGDHIRLDAAYHKCAQDVFRQLIPTLNDLVVHMNNITWAANSDFSLSQLDPLLVEIQSLTASVQMSCHVLAQMNKGIQQLSAHTHDNCTQLDATNTHDSCPQLHASQEWRHSAAAGGSSINYHAATQHRSIWGNAHKDK